jgi:predicted DCC family thiol-disulfide oxidoreductase YuxK
MSVLTLFYDGFCPLCVREMAQLRQIDKQGVLQLVDIQLADSQALYPQIDFSEASRILLALTADGRLLRGLDSTHAAWSAVGLGYRTAWLRWPVIRWFADQAYLYFAANRYRISYWLTGQARCDNGSCQR